MLFLIELHEVVQAKRDQTRLTVSSVEESGHAVSKSLRVLSCLLHGRGHVEPLHALAFDVYAGES